DDGSRHIAQTVNANQLGIVSTALQENSGYVHINGSQQFNLIGIDRTGQAIDLTNKTIWRVSDRALGSISDEGFFTPAGTAGEFTLTASFAGQTHSQTVNVSNANLVSVTVQNPVPVNVCTN